MHISFVLCRTLEIYKNKERRQQMRLLYRQVQISYKWAYEHFVRTWELAAAILFLNLYIMFGLFFCVRAVQSSEHVFIVLGAATLAMIGFLKFMFESLHSITTSSTCYVTSLNTAVPKMMKYEICYLKSCPPFVWFFGSLLVIDHQTFVWFMTEFTISSLISMLQVF
jgi:hypothetical protein